MIAVISDIHGNLWALQAVLQDLDPLSPSQVIVAGDLALGGPRPAECVELIRRRGYPAIRGNTDEWLSSAPDPITDAISWASAQLSDADRRDLADLPFLWRLPDEAGDLVVVHATPWSISDVVPPDAPEPLVRRVFAETEAAAVAYGHIHIAYVRELGDKLLVNPGSVGLPFDGDQRASYAMLSVEGGRWRATLRRVPYDVAAAVGALRGSGNPEAERFARRLERASGR
ncbi:MAG: metallophosphoesterase family protein [Bacillati bacterium ANGP1]|uniref:Phosphoesterase n=1 Tax=Candidatus Segetimicrobium genomatis TaxID=2569760 RepID=A0A537L9W3_9BACT|nr:MAG: metallophosphoesterase family protein [Terrabacteria group bacterium ANGP1]